jgi:hypothetical protein
LEVLLLLSEEAMRIQEEEEYLPTGTDGIRISPYWY